MRVLSLGQENSLEEGMATHSNYGLMVHLAAHHALPRDTFLLLTWTIIGLLCKLHTSALPLTVFWNPERPGLLNPTACSRVLRVVWPLVPDPSLSPALSRVVSVSLLPVWRRWEFSPRVTRSALCVGAGAGSAAGPGAAIPGMMTSQRARSGGTCTRCLWTPRSWILKSKEDKPSRGPWEQCVTCWQGVLSVWLKLQRSTQILILGNKSAALESCSISSLSKSPLNNELLPLCHMRWEGRGQRYSAPSPCPLNATGSLSGSVLGGWWRQPEERGTQVYSLEVSSDIHNVMPLKILIPVLLVVSWFRSPQQKQQNGAPLEN